VYSSYPYYLGEWREIVLSFYNERLCRVGALYDGNRSVVNRHWSSIYENEYSSNWACGGDGKY